MSDTVSPLEAIRLGLRGSFTLDAASGRAEFAYWTLFLFLLTYALNAVVRLGMLAVIGTVGDSASAFPLLLGLGVLAPLVMLALLPATFSVTVRRLHDLDKSGWWVLLGVIPFVGFLFLLALLLVPSQNGRWYDFR